MSELTIGDQTFTYDYEGAIDGGRWEPSWPSQVDINEINGKEVVILGEEPEPRQTPFDFDKYEYICENYYIELCEQVCQQHEDGMYPDHYEDNTTYNYDDLYDFDYNE